MELTGWEAAKKRAAQESLEVAASAREPAAQEQADCRQTSGKDAPRGQRLTPGPHCPYCGGALQEGFVRSRDHLQWYGTKEGTADLDFCGAFLPKAQAWLCPSCGIVILRTRD